MKRTLMSAVAAAGIALLSVGGAVAAPPEEPAYVETIHFVWPQEFVFPNPCNGNLIAFSGDSASVAHLTWTPQNRLIRVDTNQLHIVGQDLTTGEIYREVGGGGSSGQLLLEEYELDGLESYTLRYGSKFIGQGAGDNFVQESVLHITVNANREVTASTEVLVSRCVG